MQRPENGNDTVSEGIAYGMMFAVYMGDKATFDGLWAYAKAHRDGKGLMNWHIDANGGTVGQGAATDADEDMALRADDGRQAVGRLRERRERAGRGDPRQRGVELEQPAPDDSGNTAGLNPSYFAPAYYRLFATYNSRWIQVVDQSYTKLNACANATTGLVPDWCTQSRRHQQPRLALLLRRDAHAVPDRPGRVLEQREPRATHYLAKVAAFFNGLGPTNIKDGYNTDGTNPGTNGAVMSFEGPPPRRRCRAARMYANFMFQLYTRVAVTAKGGTSSAYNYYNGSWGLMTLMLMTGNMTPF